jgi:hypothetical protein
LTDRADNLRYADSASVMALVMAASPQYQRECAA